jgi:hypothetical protein
MALAAICKRGKSLSDELYLRRRLCRFRIEPSQGRQKWDTNEVPEDVRAAPIRFALRECDLATAGRQAGHRYKLFVQWIAPQRGWPARRRC